MIENAHNSQEFPELLFQQPLNSLPVHMQVDYNNAPQIAEPPDDVPEQKINEGIFTSGAYDEQDAALAEVPKTNDASAGPQEQSQQPRSEYSPQFTVTTDSSLVDPATFDQLYKEHTANERDALSVPHEVPLSDEEWKDISDTHKALVVTADKLGVDLRDRLPAREHYHSFDSKDTYSEYVTAHYGDTSDDVGDSHGLATPEGIFLQKGQAPVIAQHIIAHETAHFVSGYGISVDASFSTDSRYELQYDVTIDRVGYRNVGHILDEVVTEMLTDRVQEDAHREAAVAYRDTRCLYDDAVRETASKHNLAPYDVKDTLIRGLLTGEQTGISLIREALGPQRAERLLSLEYDDVNDIDATIAVAKELQLAGAVEALEYTKASEQEI